MKNNIMIITTIVLLILFNFINVPISSLSQNSKKLDLIDYKNTNKFDKLIKSKNSFDLKLSKFESNNLIVKFKSNKNIMKFKSNYNFSSIDLSNVYKMSLTKNENLLSTIKELQKSPDVEYVQPDYIMKKCLEPSDPYYFSSGSWEQNFQDLYGMHLIDMKNAWDINTGSDTIIVAVVDTGIDYNHDDIKNNMWINSDEIPDNDIDDDNDGFIDNIYGANIAYDNGDPMDDNGHGTHCAGIIGAVGDNNKGIVGVNWQTNIMAIKALNSNGEALSSSLANGIKWAADNGADIISNSWGSDFRLPINPVIEDAVDYANKKGCLLVFAAGNSNDNVEYYSPANMDETITVAATTHKDKKAFFSNWGEKIDVCAPGNQILSLRAHNTDMNALNGQAGSHFVPPYNKNAKYYRASGTSMACPYVAGLAALLLANNPSLNLNMIKTIICNSIDEIESEKKIGLGRINVSKALNSDTVTTIINSFPNYGEVKDIISINGFAWSDNFHNYSIHYGRGKNPDNWIKIKNSVDTVQNDILTTLDTTNLEDGYYTLKLKVVCNGGTIYYDHVGIVVNNFNDYIVVNKDVDSEYICIMDAVDDTGSGDEIFVSNGIYNENIILQRSVKLTGEDKENTIIHSRKLTAFYILADQINIKNFKIKTNGNSNLASFGIYIQSDNNEISDIKIFSEGSTDIGIVLFYASANSIYNCNIHRKSYDVGDVGIVLFYASENSIYNCSLKQEWCSIHIEESSNNKITNCTFFKNYISIISNVSANNLLFHNNFINSYLGHAFDNHNNNWDNGHEGNYWDDFNGIDKNRDNIGDNQYDIAEGDNKDRYPLMKAYNIKSNPPNIPITPIGSTYGTINTSYNYSTKANDPEDDEIKFGWDWNGDDLVDEWTDYQSDESIIKISHSWDSIGKYKIKVKAKDIYGSLSNFSEILIVNISGDDKPPGIQLIKPQRALYIYNTKIRKYLFHRTPLIIGKIDIEVEISDEGSGLDYVKFYIDEELKANVTSKPYKYIWTDRIIFNHKHIIKVTAYDNSGNQNSTIITVKKYL